MKNLVRNGVFFPDFETSFLENNLFKDYEYRLIKEGFYYLSIPSLITKDTYERQAMIPWEKVFKIDDNFALAGSAEQGILELFKGLEVEECAIYAKNQCFRSEPSYNGLKHLREFIKLEQFVFCRENDTDYYFDKILGLAISFLKDNDIEYRVVDVTKRDPGYHKSKFDIEVKTKTYGWMETHSCSSFGEEQTRRFDITGATHTLSNTGIASPRILVPFLERI